MKTLLGAVRNVVAACYSDEGFEIGRALYAAIARNASCSFQKVKSFFYAKHKF